MLLVMLAVSVWIINAAYNYQGSLRRIGDYRFQSAALAGAANVNHDSERWGNRFVGTWLETIPILLPCDYVQGIDTQRSDFERGMRSYLAGEWQSGGWWYFYLYALAVKVPLGTWGLFFLAIGASAMRRGYIQNWRDEIMLLVPAAGILLLVSSQTGLSLHPRYVLPTAPFMFVWISRLGRSFARQDWPIVAPAAIALCWSAASSLWIYPHSLSYFNELAGGPKNGHEHLVSSGIGWGQDLLFLKDWLERHPEAKPLRLASFGQVDPNLMGVDFLLPPTVPLESDAEAAARTQDWAPPPAWYAIDVNHLRGTGESAPDGRRGRHFPRTYGGEFTYFQALKPVATAGYSICIYHVRPPQTERTPTGFSVDSAKRSHVE